MNQENKLGTQDYDATCNGCGIGMSESEINYTNDEGHDYCIDCNEAIQSDDESSGRLNKADPETVREAAKAEMGVDYEPHMSQTDQSFIQGAEFGVNWQKEHSYTEQKWISVEDRLPKDDEIILAYGIGDKVSMCIYNNGVFNRYVDHIPQDRIMSIYYDSITHWMPIPEPATEAALCNTYPTPPIYTQEQMLAFGEAVKQECANKAKYMADNAIVYYPNKAKREILSIDISKLLNK